MASAASVAERWRQDLGEAFGHLEPEAFDAETRRESGHGLNGSLVAAPLGRAGFFSVRGTPQVVRRTLRSISAAPQDPLKLCIQIEGTAVLHQADREVLIEPGQLALYDTGRPYDLRLAGLWTCSVVTVPRDAFQVTDVALDAAMRQPFSVASGPGGLLANLTEFALKQAMDADGEETSRAHLGEAGIELVASLLDSVPHWAVDDSGVREAVLSYVRSHLHDPDLSHASVAAAHHMSPRTLNRLFEGRGQTVTDAIRTLRLEGVLAELRDPRWRRTPVMALAARWGFRDQGHFTRAFKAQFGVTPAAFRRASLAP
jgi:AraC-like DNA-binding protein